MEDEGVPVETGGGAEVDVVRGVGELDREGEGEVEDEAGEAGVRDEEVGAAAESEQAEVIAPGEVDGFKELGLRVDFGEEAGGATDAEGGEGREDDVFLDLEGRAVHGFEGTTMRDGDARRGRP